jgi:hypothetical protein
MVKQALGGERPTIFTEFGIDGMPEFEKVRDVYGKFRWTGYGLMPVDRSKSDLSYYGREVGQEDWRETQAAQALAVSGIIGRLRENLDAFAGFYSVTMVDPWTFYWGLVDANYNAKLAYFVVRSCYAHIYVSALHGTTAVSRSDGPLIITASNFGEAVEGLSLEVVVGSETRHPRMQKRFDALRIPGSGAVSEIGELDITGVPAGLYSFELVVNARGSAPLQRRLELAYLR